MESRELESMKEDLERSISSDAMDLIRTILDNVNKLSDVGKLLLYLKLPPGSFLHSLQTVMVNKDNSNNQTVINWLKTHLKENKDAYLPKQEVYEKYRSFASQNHFNIISMTEFGRAVRTVFPHVRERRLGKRGGTKYVHHGIQYATAVPVCNIPEIPAVISPSSLLPKQNDPHSDSVNATTVVLEWAQKLCDHQFGSISDLAEFLIQKQYVSSRSLHAFSVMTEAAVKSNSTIDGLLPTADAGDTCPTTNDTHALLRKNVQERKAMVLLKDKMEEERRLVRAQNGNVTTSGSPSGCNCMLTKAALGKSFVSSSSATPPKRILPKSASEDLEKLQKTAVAKVESVTSNMRPANIRPSTSAASAHIMLMSPHTSQIESPVIVLPSPIVSSRPVGQVVASPTVLHKSQQPSNQTILLVPTADHLPQLKPFPGSTTIRNLSFTENDGLTNVVPGNNHAIVPCFQNALGATVKPVVGSTRIAGSLQQVTANSGMSVASYVCRPVIPTAAQRRVCSTASTTVTTLCVTSQTTSRSHSVHKSSTTAAVSSSSSSKTVMSLLRENNGRDLEWKSYMKDSRPVASLLKEERLKHQIQMAAQFAAVQSTCQPPVAVSQPLLAGEQIAQFSFDYESLSFKPSAVGRRSSFERPCSVSDMLNLTALYTTSSDVPSTSASSLSAGTTRKRPHTAMDEPQALSVPPDESFRVQGLDRTLNIDMIEKSALDDDFLSDSCLLSTIPKSERLKADDIGVDFDLDIAEPPPAKVSLVNRSAENMTLQQLQQATLLRKSLREHCKQSHSDAAYPPLFAGRPVSTLGEPLSSSDGLSVRDSRPNTVAAFWEPAGYRDSSSSVGSCDSQLPDFSAANTYSHFTPIQNLSEDVPSTSGLVRPTAKVPTNGLNEINTEPGSELQVSAAGSEVVKQDCKKQRRRLRHKSLNRSIPQVSSGEQWTVLSDCGASSFHTERSDSPLSAEISDIIASDQRIHLGLAEFMGHASEETPSPYRSRSVPASVMLDFSLSDALAAEFTSDGTLDILTGGTEPSCNNSHLGSLRNLPVSNDVNFWDRPARGDHLISGVSFRPVPRNSGMVVRMTSKSKETDTVDVVTHTPPNSANVSPNFEIVFQPSQPDAVTTETPTSLESTSVSDRFVEELLKEVCENGSELLDWGCSS